jgi:guanylate kinase
MSRKTESDEQIKHRMALAMNEIAQEEQEKLCDYTIENDDRQKALERFEAIILKILNFHEKDV